MASRGGAGHRDRSGARAAARNRNDAVRNHAQRIAGAHVAGGRARTRARSFRRVPQMGTRRGGNRARHGRWDIARAESRAGRGRDSRARDRGGRAACTSGRLPPGARRSRRCGCSTAAALVPFGRRRRGPHREFPPPARRRRRLLRSIGSRSSTIRWCGRIRAFGPGAGDAAVLRLRKRSALWRSRPMATGAGAFSRRAWARCMRSRKRRATWLAAGARPDRGDELPEFWQPGKAGSDVAVQRSDRRHR